MLAFAREVGDDPLMDILEWYGAQQPLPELVPLEEENFPEVVEFYEMMQECILGFS